MQNSGIRLKNKKGKTIIVIETVLCQMMVKKEKGLFKTIKMRI